MIQTSKYTDAQKKRLDFYKSYKFETPKTDILNQENTVGEQIQADPELLKRNQEQVAKQVESQRKITIPDVLYRGLEELKNIYETPGKLINQGVEKLQNNPLAGAIDLGQGIAQGVFTMSGIPQTFSAISTGLKGVFGEETGKQFDNIMNLPSTAVEQGTKAIDKVIDPQIQHKAVTMAVQGLLSTGRPEFQMFAPLLTEAGQSELAQSINEVNKLSATLLSFDALAKTMPKKTTPIEIKNIPKNEVVKENIIPNAEQQTSDLPTLSEVKNATPKGQEPKSNIEQYPQVNEGTLPTETSNRNSNVESGKVETPQVTEVKTEVKPVEEHIIKEPISNLPKPIGDKLQNTAQDLIDEVSNASIERSGTFTKKTSTLLGEDVQRQGNSTINTFPEWFSQLGKSKTEIIKGLQKILEDAGEDKGKLVEDLKGVILDRLQGNHNDIMRVGSGGKFETKNFGKIPGDTEITDFINNVKDNVTLDQLYQEYKTFEDQTSFNFGANEKPQESLFSGKDNAPVFRTNKGMYDKGQGKGAEGTPLFDQIKTDKGQLELPQKPIDTSTLQQLNMGIDLGIDKFITQDVKPALQKVGEIALKGYQALKSVPNFIGGIFQPAFKSIKKFGNESYSNVIEGIHRPEKENIIFNNQKLETYDTNFAGLEKFFNTFTPEEINKFNLSRGTAQSPEAIRLQNEAKSSLNGRLLDKQLFSAIKEVSDYNYKLATDNGLTLDYFKDYFFGAYKDPKQVTKFLDYWQTTEKFTKEKSIPTIADATAFGLELKDPNPITNLRKETEAISRRVGILDIQKFNEKSNAPYMVRVEEAKPEQLKNWESLGDSAFKGFLYEPTYAKFVNSLISTNKISQSGFLKAMKQTSFTLQQVKFLGSLFHLWNMAKHSIAGNTGGIANPKGFLDIVRGFKKYEESSPEYIEYTGLGGSHKYSIESEAQTQMTKALDKLSEGNALGGFVRLPVGLLQQKWVPLSPGMVKWMFQDYIPTLKFERWKQDNIKMSEQLGRPLTKAEKIANIRTIQQFYGEMNERLYGRSGTVTSALRLIFMAPGYGEGNFRTLASSMNLKELTKTASQSRKNLKYVANSLTATLTLATIGTAIMTGKTPESPKTMEDVRDLFKIKTGQKDGNGDEIYTDLMTYDKDYWAVYGEMATGHLGGALKEFTRRVSGAVAPGFKTLNDMTTLFNGGMIYDYKGDPIFYNTDNLNQKVGKFLSYEGGQMLPISTSVYSQSTQKGESTIKSIITSGVGLRPTTSEEVKRLKETRNDLISMKDEKLKTQLALNKLANENPEEAEKQRVEFNNKQTEKLNSIKQETGYDWKENLFLIKKLNPYQSKTVEESVRNLLQGKKKKVKINIY